jgi:hypothetical protein
VSAEDFGVFSQLADCSAQVFVHWKQISSDDRFPILVKGLEADGGRVEISSVGDMGIASAGKYPT